MNAISRGSVLLVSSLLLCACAQRGSTIPDPAGAAPAGSAQRSTEVRTTEHRDGDDLLSAGLGLDGLRAAAPPPLDAGDPSQSLWRRQIWHSWRGIADLAPGGGFGEIYGSMPDVPGREFQALLTVPAARHPHRVLLQLPDAFDAERRCLVLTASSGSRGIHGAIALAGGWGLPRGCAVAYSDKGAGSGHFDVDRGEGVRLDGTRGAEDAEFEFAPSGVSESPHLIAMKHAHSGDNPEADWGRHLRQAAEFALAQLDRALPEQAPFTFDNTRVIAAGLSNGGAAVLQAAGEGAGWLDGVVAIAPNVLAPTGGRAAYDYISEAALLLPCALLHPDFDAVPFARTEGAAPPAWRQRCASLAAAGLLAASTTEAQAAEAYRLLLDRGWTRAAMEAGAISVAFDLYRAVGVTYASAYLRRGPDRMPCGYAFAALDESAAARASTAAERALWYSDSSGIAPGAGIGIVDGMAAGDDPSFPGLLCLRKLYIGEGADGDALRAAVEDTRAGVPPADLPITLIHGMDDGLIVEAFSGHAYADALRAGGRPLLQWRVPNAQHFDAFLGMPALAGRYLPLLPYGYAALDRMMAELDAGIGPRSEQRVLQTRTRELREGSLEPLTVDHLGVP